MTRAPVLSLLACLALAGCITVPAPASPTPAVVHVSDDLELHRIAPDVWRHTSWARLASGARFPSNGLVIRRGDRLVLVDTAWGEASTAALLDWIDANLKLPVAHVIVTHYHDDRLGGAAVLARRGIPFHGSALTRELAARHGVQPLPQALAGLADSGATREFAGLELFYPGPAHTADNLMVWVAEAGILFGGCAVKSADAAGLGNVADADLAAWGGSLRRAARRYPGATVIAGHGDPGSIDRTLELLAELP